MQGDELAYSRYGDAPEAVLLLHSLALDRRMWPDVFIDRVAAERTVIACDLPGHGQSPLAGARTIEDMADRVAALLDALGLAAVAVVGLSMGGCVAQALAVRHPQRVRGLGLVDTTAWYGEDAPAKWAERADRARREGLHALAEFQASRWLTEGFRREHPDVLKGLLDIFTQMSIDDYAAACSAMGAVDLRAGLAGITCPTAVAVGEHDYATPVEFATLIAKSVPGASLTVLPDASHLSVVERPDAVVDAVREAL